MPKKRHTPEEIIQHLRTVEIEQSKGSTLEEAARKVGVTPPTLARWKAEYGGLRVSTRPGALKSLNRKMLALRRS